MALSRKNEISRVCQVGGAANVKKKQDCFFVYPQSGNGEILPVYTIHISCKSDAYGGDDSSYGGIIMYGREGEGDWYTKNGTRCKSGYVVIMQTNTNEFEKLQKTWGNEPGKVHGIIYRKAFGESCNEVNVVGEGFAVMNGEFKTISGAFNPSHGDDYHNDSWKMHPDSAKCVEKVVNWWKGAQRNFLERQNHSVESLLSSDND